MEQFKDSRDAQKDEKRGVIKEFRQFQYLTRKQHTKYLENKNRKKRSRIGALPPDTN